MITSRSLVVVLVSLVAVACARRADGPRPDARTRALRDAPCAADEPAPGDDLMVCVAPGVWRFTLLAPDDRAFPGFPANGLVVRDGDASILIDAGWEPSSLVSVLAFAERRAIPITRAIVTHSHDDRTGGLAALTTRSIPVLAIPATRARLPAEPLAPLEVADLGDDLAWLFPGHGHSPDNIVVYHRPSRTLFAGCFVKQLDSTSLGYVDDADLASWALALERVKAAFPEASVVIPGHGEPGGPELIDHTLALVRERLGGRAQE